MNDREKCDRMLEALFPNQQHLQVKWWSSPNKAFDMSTPEQTLAMNSKLVVQYLLIQFNGDFS